MENKVEILVAGTQQKILETVLRLLNTNVSWNATGVSSVEDALEQCRAKNYHVFLLGAGFTTPQEQELTVKLSALYPRIQVVPHYGGGSGLLFAEIYLALGTINQAQ